MAQLSLPVDFSAQRKSAGERRMQQLRILLGDRRNTLVLMHNDPDPDAIAAGYALQRLIRHLLPAASVTLGHGGMIGRAENRTMAQLLVPHALRIPTFEAATALAAYDAILLVDTQLSAGNHLFYEIDYTAGGHDTMAGGRIHAPNASPAQRIAELHALVPRFLQMLGAGEAAGMPLLDTIGP